MQTTIQFSVFLINKPGALAQVLDAVARARVNVVALTIVDSHEHGVLRVVGDNVESLRAALRQPNLPVHESQVLAVELPNRPGAFAGLARRLAEAHVNIEYAYVTAGAKGGKTTAILHVDNMVKAGHVLREDHHQTRQPGFNHRMGRGRS